MNEDKKLTGKENVMLCVASVLILCFLLFPLYWALNTSLKTEQEIFQNPPTFYPHELNTASYAAQVESGDFNMFRSFGNSFLISLGAMLIAVVLAVPASYGIAKYRFKGRKLVLLSFLVTQMLPVSVLLTPMFIMFKNMHVYNTWVSAILADATIGIAVHMRGVGEDLLLAKDQRFFLRNTHLTAVHDQIGLPLQPDHTRIVDPAPFTYQHAAAVRGPQQTDHIGDAHHPQMSALADGYGPDKAHTAVLADPHGLVDGQLAVMEVNIDVLQVNGLHRRVRQQRPEHSLVVLRQGDGILKHRQTLPVGDLLRPVNLRRIGWDLGFRTADRYGRFCRRSRLFRPPGLPDSQYDHQCQRRGMKYSSSPAGMRPPRCSTSSLNVVPSTYSMTI